MRGQSHVSASTPNQDSWSSFHLPWADGIVVSDGLGSKKNSGFGSLSACRAVEDVIRACGKSVRSEDTMNLLPLVHAQWLRRLGSIDPREAGATCLFALRFGDGQLRLGLLGDGCIVAVKLNGDVHTLTPDKAEVFSNMTAALSSETQRSDWTIAELHESECSAVFLCSDGVSDDINDIHGFMTEMNNAFGELADISASRNLRDALMAWPVPKHSDDLTIAGLVRRVFDDE